MNEITPLTVNRESFFNYSITPLTLRQQNHSAMIQSPPLMHNNKNKSEWVQPPSNSTLVNIIRKVVIALTACD